MPSVLIFSLWNIYVYWHFLRSSANVVSFFTVTELDTRNLNLRLNQIVKYGVQILAWIYSSCIYFCPNKNYCLPTYLTKCVCYTNRLLCKLYAISWSLYVHAIKGLSLFTPFQAFWQLCFQFSFSEYWSYRRCGRCSRL